MKPIPFIYKLTEDQQKNIIVQNKEDMSSFRETEIEYPAIPHPEYFRIGIITTIMCSGIIALMIAFSEDDDAIGAVIVPALMILIGIYCISIEIKEMNLSRSMRNGQFQVAEVVVTDKRRIPKMNEKQKEIVREIANSMDNENGVKEVEGNEEEFLEFLRLHNDTQTDKPQPAYLYFNDVRFNVNEDIFNQVEKGQTLILLIVKKHIMGIQIP